MSALVEGLPWPGLLVAAVRRGQLEAYVHIPVSDEPEFRIVGRHARCDLPLTGDARLSLRHLLVVGRRAGKRTIAVRVLELRTRAGMLTEQGRWAALSAQGPIFLRAASYRLFLLPTGELNTLPWKEEVDKVWQVIVDRQALGHRPKQWPSSDAKGGRTSGGGGPVLGFLDVVSDDGQLRMAVRTGDLDRALLIGRSSRCGLRLWQEGLSRIHLIILREGDGIWVVDAASTRGTTCAGDTVRALPLRPGTRLLLADTVSVAWSLPH